MSKLKVLTRTLVVVLLVAFAACVGCQTYRPTVVPLPPRDDGFKHISGSVSQTTIVYRSGWFDVELRDSVLFRAWSDSVGQFERGGCVTEWNVLESRRNDVFKDGQQVVTVIDSSFIVRKVNYEIEGASWTRIKNLKCARGQPFWHTHPPQSCTLAGNCRSGGYYAYQCQASPVDLASLILTEAPFAILQCGPNQWVFYYPRDLQVDQKAPK